MSVNEDTLQKTTDSVLSKKDVAENGDQVDDVIDENTRLTISKESPLSDVATSPPPFDLALPDSELDLNSEFLSNKNENPDAQGGDNHGADQQNAMQEVNEKILDASQDRPTSRTNNDFQLGEISRQRKDSYESSELSDLGDDESEAETDKMDFLDERDGENLVKPTDLQTLSELTELARLEEIDGDSDEEFAEAKGTVKNAKDGLQSSSINNKLEDMEESEDAITRKRTATRANDEYESVGYKKIKTDTPIESSLGGVGAENKEETREEDTKAEDEAKDSNDVVEFPEKVASKSTDKIGHDDEDNEAEAEDEGEEDDDAEEDEEGESRRREKLTSIEQQEHQDKVITDAEELKDAQEALEKSVEQVVAEENDTDINEQRELAVKGLIAIEKCFAEVRDKLYDDKLSLLEKELQLCLDGSHPELSKIYQKINGFYQDSLNLANANLTYRLKCVDKETMATRTSIHQNYLRNIMDTKNAMITETTSMWYKINKERNQLDQIVPDFNYAAIPSSILAQEELPVSSSGIVTEVMGPVAPKMKKAIKQSAIVELVQQRNNLNEQLGILNGLVKFHGFPSAVSSSINQDDVATRELLLRKASEEEINEDLKAMGIPT
ncbi:DEP1 [Candida margitis]|uniref:DEP1 n=1 Tax=Candida margitis TaxID=1775924 RepID=UPI0022274F92|nr:DEP1 [Candida margitis]KAI5954081.1 DEP1 [Candida margitis]